MSTEKESLLKLLRARSVKLGAATLSSGARSDFYIDVRLTSMSSRGHHLVGEVIREATQGFQFQAIGGPETGAIPLAGAALEAWGRGSRELGRGERELEGFWVRRTPKSHGSQRLIEGNLQPGMRAVIVDDVVTSGESVIGAVQAVRAHGCEVVAIVCLVDRLAGARQLLADHGVPTYTCIYTAKDFELAPSSTKTERGRDGRTCRKCGLVVPMSEWIAYGNRHEDCAVPRSSGGSSPSLKRMPRTRDGSVIRKRTQP